MFSFIPLYFSIVPLVFVSTYTTNFNSLLDGGNLTDSTEKQQAIILETQFQVEYTDSHERFLDTIFRNNSFNDYFTSSNSTVNSSNVFVILSESTPLLYNNVSYYWNGYSPETTQMWECQYVITENDMELYEVEFENGTKPEKLIFGCTNRDSCCGLECCRDVKVIYAVLLISVFVVLFFLNRCCEKYGCCQYENFSAISASVPEASPTRRSSLTPVSEMPSPRSPVPPLEQPEAQLSTRISDPEEMKTICSTEIVAGMNGENFDDNNDNSFLRS